MSDQALKIQIKILKVRQNIKHQVEAKYYIKKNHHRGTNAVIKFLDETY